MSLTATVSSSGRRLIQVLGRFHLAPFLAIRGGMGKGLKISLYNASANYWRGTNELPVQRAVVEALRPGHVFYDIGSNVGFFALIAARAVGGAGQVYAFEPAPDTADCLRANVQRNGFRNVTVLEMAVGATAGTAEFFITKHPGGPTLKGQDKALDLKKRIPVRVETIDRLIATGRIAPPDVVKIDVEGAELDVLQGMSNTLVRHRPSIIYEVDGKNSQALERAETEIGRVLRAADYDVSPIERSYSLKEIEVHHAIARPPAKASPSAGRQ